MGNNWQNRTDSQLWRIIKAQTCSGMKGQNVNTDRRGLDSGWSLCHSSSQTWNFILKFDLNLSIDLGPLNCWRAGLIPEMGQNSLPCRLGVMWLQGGTVETGGLWEQGTQQIPHCSYQKFVELMRQQKACWALFWMAWSKKRKFNTDYWPEIIHTHTHTHNDFSLICQARKHLDMKNIKLILERKR